MKASIRQTLDLFRTVFIHENGVDDFCLPELTDIKNVCRTVIELAEEKESEYRTKKAKIENEQLPHSEGNLVDGVPSEKSERYNNF